MKAHGPSAVLRHSHDIGTGLFVLNRQPVSTNDRLMQRDAYAKQLGTETMRQSVKMNI